MPCHLRHVKFGIFVSPRRLHLTTFWHWHRLATGYASIVRVAVMIKLSSLIGPKSVLEELNELYLLLVLGVGKDIAVIEGLFFLCKRWQFTLEKAASAQRHSSGCRWEASEASLMNRTACTRWNEISVDAEEIILRAGIRPCSCIVKRLLFITTCSRPWWCDRILRTEFALGNKGPIQLRRRPNQARLCHPPISIIIDRNTGTHQRREFPDPSLDPPRPQGEKKKREKGEWQVELESVEHGRPCTDVKEENHACTSWDSDSIPSHKQSSYINSFHRT